MYYWCNDTAERDRILNMLAESGEKKVDVYSIPAPPICKKETEMLKHGDKMYRVSGTKLEAVTFIEEG